MATSPYGNNPYGSLGPSPAVAARVRPKAPWEDLQDQMGKVFGPGAGGEQAAIDYGWSQGLANDQASGGMFAGPWKGNQVTQRTGRMVTPDYSGILGSFTADSRARFGAGLAAKSAQALSQRRAMINKLGVRDVPGMLGKLQQYGLTQADLQGAADNPWSELKALDFHKRQAWNQAVAGRAARGGYRSGGTVGAREFIDQEAARHEAGLTQEALQGLSESQFGLSEWEREQRDQMEQSIAQQQSSLAAAYQPYWQYD